MSPIKKLLRIGPLFELLDGSGTDASSKREPRVGFIAHWVDSFRRQRNAQVRDAAALEDELRSLEAI